MREDFYRRGVDESLEVAKKGNYALASFKVLVYVLLLLIDWRFDTENN